MSAKQFRKKPIAVEAMQVTPSNCAAVADWINGSPGAYKSGYDGLAYPDIGGVEIPVLPDMKHVRAEWGDWVVRGVQGEHYPCTADIFEATYEAVE